ncbi:discoidin domain-containing protein [Fodinicola feengrottensis]|uniref:discoidin domain-containing protein n=1 Tax=Fodinicola feengrottensis TaxID=435914 RepID=UPI0013D7D474|nr:discoidin domain-containing protein [Fodinicola feengrottensis]
MTEWNWTPAFNLDPMNNDHPNMISFDSNRLTNMYLQHTDGALFYADNDNSVNPDFFGVYANGTMTPKSRAYHLLSQDLGLGAGPGTIRGISYAAPVTNAAAAHTAAGENVAWVVNDGTSPLQIDLRLTGLGGGSSVQANVFEASANQAVGSPRSSTQLAVSAGAVTVPLSAPAKSLVGVRLTSYPIADETNLAPAATATASSSSGGFVAAEVTDGIIGRWGLGEWASNGEKTPWVQLTWPTAQSIGRVVLYDRSNTTDRVTSGTLIFSDGSSVPVPALSDDGTGKAISFAPRDVSSVRLQVDSSSSGTLNSGLSEFQVFHGDNVAPDATVTSSSQLDTGAHSQVNAVDGISGQANGQWVSTESTPWIRTTWINPRPVNEVVLRDQVGGSGHANSGTLTFSDGSSVPVTGIATDGSPKSVSFPARSVGWVQFQADGGTGSDVGLSELQVFQAANLASAADVSASSVFSSTADGTLPATGATDEIINQWYAGEWGSQGEKNPWIQLNWPTVQTVGSVVLYDRNNLIDWTMGGTLTFSDGSTVAVSGIDNTRLGKVVTFPTRTTTSIRFQVTASGTGSLNNGLSEIQVFAG